MSDLDQPYVERHQLDLAFPFGDRNYPDHRDELSTDHEIASLLKALEAGDINLESPKHTQDLSCDSATAWLVISTANRYSPGKQISFAADVLGDMKIRSPLIGDLVLLGSINGDVRVSARVGGHLVLARRGSIKGQLGIYAEVAGSVGVEGLLGGDLLLAGDNGVIGENLVLSGPIRGSVGSMGEIRGYLGTKSRIGGDLLVLGTVNGGVALAGKIEGHTALARRDNGPLPVATLSARLGGEVLLGQGVSLAHCDFAGFLDFDKLQSLHTNLFDRSDGWLVVDEAPRGNTISPQELASLYRQLRRVFESQGNRPGAGDFYRGEMRARQRSARLRCSSSVSGVLRVSALGELAILSLYGLLSSYGLRAWKPVVWLLASIGLVAVLFQYNGLDLNEELATQDRNNVLRASWGEAIWFSAQSLLAFVSSPPAELGTWGRFLQIGCRFTGPVLVAQAVIAVRERVAR